MKSTADTKLLRSLGVWSASAVIIGDMIGTAIFLVTSDMARLGGSALVVFVAWILGAFVSIFGAFCYAELGAAIPVAGGDYVYLSRGLSPVWGFLFGWMVSFVERPAAIAAISSGLLYFLAFLIPALTAPSHSLLIHLPWANPSSAFSLSGAQLLAAAVIWFVTGINYLGVRLGAEFQVGITALKVVSLLGLIVIALLFTANGVHHLHDNISIKPGHWSVLALVSALVPAMWAYTGFGDLGHLGSEIQQPERNIPLAIVSSVLLVALIYIGVNLVYFDRLSFSEIVDSRHVASDVVSKLLGYAGASWLTIAMMISALGSVNAVVMTGARVPFAMARDGLFFRAIGRIQPSFHTPGAALILQAALASLLVLSGTYQQLYSLAIFALSLFFALTAVALIRLRSKERDLKRPYRTWGYPVVPLIFLLAMVMLSVNLLWTEPLRSCSGLLIILAGLPFYRFWRRSTSASEEPGRLPS